MYAICALLVVHAVIGMLLCGFLVWRSWDLYRIARAVAVLARPEIQDQR